MGSRTPAVHRVADRALDAAGGVPAGEHRSFRAGAEGLRAFHVADPPLSGPVVHRALSAAPGVRADTESHARRPRSWRRSARSSRGSRSAPTRRIVTSSTFLKCIYLRERIGQTFDGLITTVVEFGCFVQMLDVGGRWPAARWRRCATTTTRWRAMAAQWVGKRSKRRLRPACALRVVVTAVNPVEGLIDLELAETDDGEEPSTACTRCGRC